MRKGLVWNVYKEDFNRKEIEVFNIFNHYSFSGSLKKGYKKGMTEADFKEMVKRNLMYFFWAKCQYEITLWDWPWHEKFNAKKVDIYSQVMLNEEIFMDYVWQNRKLITNYRMNDDRKGV